MASTRRKFTREFKLAAIDQIESGKPMARVARELGLHENTLRRWKQEFQQDPVQAFPGLGKAKPPSREEQLQRKIDQLALERDFLLGALQRLEELQLLDNAGADSRYTKTSKKK